MIKTEKLQASEIAKKRQRRWFEKFDWFITSEGYLVIAGKSGDQNELLVKRYIRKDDIFVCVCLVFLYRCMQMFMDLLLLSYVTILVLLLELQYQSFLFNKQLSLLYAILLLGIIVSLIKCIGFIRHRSAR